MVDNKRYSRNGLTTTNNKRFFFVTHVEISFETYSSYTLLYQRTAEWTFIKFEF